MSNASAKHIETAPMTGIGLMVLSVALISVQEALAKYLGQHMPIGQVIWARYAGHFLSILLLLWPVYGASIVKTKRPLIQIGRSLLLLVDTALFYLGLRWVGLAEATAIFFTVPIMVLLLSVFFLGERIGWRSILAVSIAFLGTLLIVRPGVDGLGVGALFILGAAVCVAVYNITTRALADMDSLPVTLFYTALVGAVLSTLALPFFWQSPEGCEQIGAMVAIGLFGGGAHCCMIAAHNYARASTVAPFMYSQIIWAVGLGWLMFGALPDMAAVIGSLVVIASGIYLLKRGRV